MEEMKIKNILLAFIAMALFFLIALSGCTDNKNSENDKNKFIGTWELQPFEGSDPLDRTTYTFYMNSTLISIFYDYDGEVHEGWADYYIENDKLCMKTHPHGAITDDDLFCYDYDFSDGDTKLVLTTSELPTVTLTKVE